MHIPAQLKYIILAIFFTLGSINAIRTTKGILESSKRLEQTDQEVLSLKNKKEELETSIEYKETDDYIEEAARNELNLVRPGEEIYIFPEDLATKEEEVLENESTELDLKTRSSLVDTKDTPPIEQWKELLF